jgi:hypothetical protein
MGTKSAWTPERRARQAQIIRRTKPWLRSTGPRTREGKARSSQNAAAFKNDPDARAVYLAMRRLIKNPALALSAPFLPERGEFDWTLIDSDLALPGPEDMSD